MDACLENAARDTEYATRRRKCGKCGSQDYEEIHKQRIENMKIALVRPIYGLDRIVLGHIVSEPGYWSVRRIAYDLIRPEKEIRQAVNSLYSRGYVTKSNTKPVRLNPTRVGYDMLGVDPESSMRRSRATRQTLRERVHDRLKEISGETADEIAIAVCASRASVDKHLQFFLANGTVTRTKRPPTGGRPAYVWFFV